MTTLETRRLNWDACHNARDLGGLPTKDGGGIRPLALMRTDNHDRLTKAGQAALRESGVSLILDLRSKREAREHPSPFRGTPLYRNLPFEGDDEQGRTLMQAQPELAGVYRVTLDRYRARAGAVIAALTDAPPGGLILHCHSGKDRTGLAVALALSVAGVSREVIAQDYALTDDCLRPHYADELRNVADEARRERLRSLQHARPETMLAVLEHLDKTYGGVAAYLLGAGVTGEQLAALRAMLRA